MNGMKDSKKLMFIFAICSGIFLSSCDQINDDDDNDNQTLAIAALALASQNTAGPSCNVAASNLCFNSTSITDTVCAGLGGTYSTSSNCASQNAIGSCSITNSGVTLETVYYTGNATCGSDAACLVTCNGTSGSYNADY